MTYTISLNRNYYSLQSDIYRWCAEQFGPCQNFSSELCRWSIESHFGCTTLTFTHSEDAEACHQHWVRPELNSVYAQVDKKTTDYMIGWDAYDLLAPFDEAQSQEWKDGWEDAKSADGAILEDYGYE